MIDRITPNGQWTFDEDVAQVFDDMLERSIAGYAQMRTLVTDLAARFANPNEWIVDLGCSHGESIANLIGVLGPECRYVGAEVSQPMLRRARQRFEHADFVQIRDIDLRTTYPPETACVTLAILTMMFIPIEYRMEVLHNVRKNTAKDGAFLMVEKVLGDGPELNQVLVDSYLAMKKKNGYTDEQIERKRLSLEGVLVPMTNRWNVGMLKEVGFSHVDTFWQHLNFTGYIALP